VTTLMWEVRAAEGRLAELVEWVLANAGPDAVVYRSGDDERVVLIGPPEAGPGEPPAELVRRAPHAWTFDRVR